VRSLAVWLVMLLAIGFLSGAEAAPKPGKPKHRASAPPSAASTRAAPPGEAARERPTPRAPGRKGKVEVNVTDVLGHDLHARVELQSRETEKPVVIEVPKGHIQADAPSGTYKAYVYVYSLQVPVLVDVQDVTIQSGEPAFLVVNLLEGAAGNRTLLDFDRDCDFAIDRVEVKCGTDPADARSIPGREMIPMDDRVLVKEERWYRGELHAHSAYGGGKETVAELVKRAEKAGLDFLAITDRNTVSACRDPGFKSDSVALIPAMEWGSEKRGVALLYGIRTFPEFVDSIPQAQALVDLVQAQGGFFAIAHPCFPTAPWRWGLGYVNGVEVWCRDWRAVPPVSLEELDEDMKERLNGRLVQSVAFAAATSDLSANGQAAVFYDAELVRGLKAAVIGGSYTSSPEVPMGAPVTYVYAVEKSVRGILDGLLRGRTYVSAGLNGPRLRFNVDVLKDETIDVSLGGIIPIGVPAWFLATTENAKGCELQILLNGHPLISKRIDGDPFTLRFDHTPENYAVYRLRVVGEPREKEGFGPIEVLAQSSPIYAQDLKTNNPKIEAYTKERKRRPLPTPAEQVPLPSDPTPGEIKPQWRF